MRHVIVGGGIAGTTCAEELRKLDPNAEITLIGEEQRPIYSRVLLPHYVKGKIPRERVFLKPGDWYKKQHIEWLFGVRVEKLDPRNKFVLLSDGRELPYDKLLIATGGEVNLLPEDRKGVSYFRTLDDADHLLHLLSDRTVYETAAIYGGGFIACEYLNIFAQRKIQTTLAIRGTSLFARTLGFESQTLLHTHMRSHGVDIVPETTFEALEGEDHLTGFRTNKGTHACGILGVGVGITPDLGWIKDAGVEVARGVRANEFLKTNVSDIYAGGDGAEFFDIVIGHHRVVGNWLNAVMHGRVAAHNMNGEKEAFRLVSSYATNVLGLEVIFVGEADRELADEVKIFGSAEEGGVTQVFLRDGKAIGATIIGRNRDRAPITKAIESQEPFIGL
jgi:NAD(P)H-nitrite reductase large subunit